MPAFANDAELRALVGGMFDLALADADIGPRLRATGAVIRVRCTDTSSSITVDLRKGRVHAGEVMEPTVTIAATGDVVNGQWQGKLNLMSAIATRKVVIDGGVTSLLGLAPIMSKLYPRYVELLHEAGREDLILDGTSS